MSWQIIFTKFVLIAVLTCTSGEGKSASTAPKNFPINLMSPQLVPTDSRANNIDTNYNKIIFANSKQRAINSINSCSEVEWVIPPGRTAGQIAALQNGPRSLSYSDEFIEGQNRFLSIVTIQRTEVRLLPSRRWGRDVRICPNRVRLIGRRVVGDGGQTWIKIEGSGYVYEPAVRVLGPAAAAPRRR